jgi:hypothetical protein
MIRELRVLSSRQEQIIQKDQTDSSEGAVYSEGVMSTMERSAVEVHLSTDQSPLNSSFRDSTNADRCKKTVIRWCNCLRRVLLIKSRYGNTRRDRCCPSGSGDFIASHRGSSCAGLCGTPSSLCSNAAGIRGAGRSRLCRSASRYRRLARRSVLGWSPLLEPKRVRSLPRSGQFSRTLLRKLVRITSRIILCL